VIELIEATQELRARSPAPGRPLLDRAQGLPVRAACPTVRAKTTALRSSATLAGPDQRSVRVGALDALAQPRPCVNCSAIVAQEVADRQRSFTRSGTTASCRGRLYHLNAKRLQRGSLKLTACSGMTTGWIRRLWQLLRRNAPAGGNLASGLLHGSSCAGLDEPTARPCTSKAAAAIWQVFAPAPRSGHHGAGDVEQPTTSEEIALPSPIRWRFIDGATQVICRGTPTS